MAALGLCENRRGIIYTVRLEMSNTTTTNIVPTDRFLESVSASMLLTDGEVAMLHRRPGLLTPLKSDE